MARGCGRVGLCQQPLPASQLGKAPAVANHSRLDRLCKVAITVTFADEASRLPLEIAIRSWGSEVGVIWLTPGRTQKGGLGWLCLNS